MNTNIDNFKEAVVATGGRTALARRLTEASGERVTQSRVSRWLDRGHVPAQWVPYVSIVSGVPASKINPAFAVLEQKSA